MHLPLLPLLLTAATTAAHFAPLTLNRDRGFATLPLSPEGDALLSNTTPDTIRHILPLPAGAEIETLSMRFRLTAPFTPLHSQSTPGITLALGDDLSITISHSEKSADDIAGNTSALTLRAASGCHTVSRLIPDCQYGSPEILLSLTARGDSTSIAAGSGSRPTPFSLAGRAGRDSIALIIPPGASAALTSLRSTFLPASADTAPADTAKPCPLDGEWSVYDFDIDNSLLRLHDDYRLSLHGSETADGITYTATLLSGGPIADHHGQTKAILTPSPFEGIWSVSWRAADGGWLTRGVTLTLESFPLLTLRFEQQNSVIRLRRPDHPLLPEKP